MSSAFIALGKILVVLFPEVLTFLWGFLCFSLAVVKT